MALREQNFSPEVAVLDIPNSGDQEFQILEKVKHKKILMYEVFHEISYATVYTLQLSSTDAC